MLQLQINNRVALSFCNRPRKRAYLALGDIGMTIGRYEQARLYYQNAVHFGSVTADRLAARAARYRDAQQRGEGEK